MALSMQWWDQNTRLNNLWFLHRTAINKQTINNIPGKKKPSCMLCKLSSVQGTFQPITALPAGNSVHETCMFQRIPCMDACVMHDTCMVNAQVYHSMHGVCMVLPFMHVTWGKKGRPSRMLCKSPSVQGTFQPIPAHQLRWGDSEMVHW